MVHVLLLSAFPGRIQTLFQLWCFLTSLSFPLPSFPFFCQIQLWTWGALLASRESENNIYSHRHVPWALNTPKCVCAAEPIESAVVVSECTGWAKKTEHFKKCITPVCNDVTTYEDVWYTKNVQPFIRSKTDILYVVSPYLNILCTSSQKRY